MKGFIYKEQSTENILSSSKLILVTFDSLKSITGSERENIVGEKTLTRHIPNEYGTKTSNLIFEYALVKSNFEPFTDEEQIIVERWLSSPKFSSDVDIIDCDGNIIATYCGKFTKTDWVLFSGGWAGVTFTFENNSAYPKRHFSNSFSISNNGTINLNCITDELEEYIYPTIKITQPNQTSKVTITNVTDNNNSFTLNALDRLQIIMDCQHCILKDTSTSGIVNFSDLGWKDVDNIYWLRLLPGINEIQVIGTANIEISYDSPYKKVGGWL